MFIPYSLAHHLFQGALCFQTVISLNLYYWLQSNQCIFKSKAPSSWWMRGMKLIMKQLVKLILSAHRIGLRQGCWFHSFAEKKVSGAEILALPKLGKFYNSLGPVSFTALLFYSSLLFNSFLTSQVSVQLWAFYPVGKYSVASRIWKRELLFSLNACSLLQNKACLLTLSTTLEE